MLIGYWQSPVDRQWPHPRHLVAAWEPALRAQIVDYLRRGRTWRRYRGWSYCRFGCGKNGGTEQTDGVYAWPDGLAHYVEVHSVKLPAAFVEHARARDFATPLESPIDAGMEEAYDLTFWSEWCRSEAPPRSFMPFAQVLAALVSGALAFFGLFNILFTDVATFGERLGSWGYVFALYALAAGVFAFTWSRARRAWWLWFGIPVGLVAIAVTLTEPGTLRVNLAGACFAFLGLGAGMTAGARLRAQSCWRR